MSALYQDQNTHRVVGRALVANHSRAVGRALNAYSLGRVLGQPGS